MIWKMRFPQGVALTVFMGLAVAVSAGAEPPGDAALNRLRITTASALSQTPALRAIIEDLSADEAAAAAQSGAGTPTLEYMRKGIGSSFDRQPNSQDTVSVGVPFNGPGQGSRARRLTDAASLRTLAHQRVAVLDVVRLVGEEWIKTAALADRLEVVRTRLNHLENALKLQNKRLELGEVAGTEVMQLELARAAEASMRAGLEAEAESGRHRMGALCGDGCVFPVPGDLEAIQSVLGSITRGFDDDRLRGSTRGQGCDVRQGRGRGSSRSDGCDNLGAAVRRPGMGTHPVS